MLQAQPAAVSAVTKWRFQFNYTARGSAKTETAEWTYNVNASADFILDTRVSATLWAGHPNTTIRLTATGSTNLGCKIEQTLTYTGPARYIDKPDASLSALNNGYYIVMGNSSVEGTKTQVVSAPCPGGSTSESANASWNTIFPDTNVYPASLTPGNITLSGTLRRKDTNISITAMGIAPAPIDAEINYTLTPADQDDVMLELKPASAYEDWRPTAAEGGGDGKSISFTATLKRRTDGSTPKELRIRKLEWELQETSKEPGFLINWPQQSYDTRPDLHFEERPSQGSGGSIRRPLDEEAQKTETTFPKADGLSDDIEVFPRDWGGWSTLQVTATLTNGLQVKGRIPQASEEGARIPNRDLNRRIAKGWLRSKSISDEDRSDNDETPTGDGNRGDGLTLYEEYRGFRVDGKRVEGDPHSKEYFLINETGGGADGGIALFEIRTRLKVHRLRNEEANALRVVNANTAAGPHTGEQHAVRMMRRTDFVGLARAVGGPGTPRDIEFVGLPLRWPNRPTMLPWVSDLDSGVAHELGHTVNIYHHGAGDRDVEWYRLSGVLYEREQDSTERGTPIVVYSEEGANITSSIDDSKLTVGVEHGQHSGSDTCLMRYDNARAYISKTNPLFRYAGISENVGVMLCTTPDGLGVNDSSRTPQSRYGNAMASRGACVHQILVNDMVPAPGR